MNLVNNKAKSNVRKFDNNYAIIKLFNTTGNKMESTNHCPTCGSEYTYPDGNLIVCSMCAHEWDPNQATTESSQREVKDSNGNLLADGDDILLIKDLKLKGSSTVLKKGAKAKGIRLVDGDHEIDCKIDGMKIMLKACFVKKA